jgi:hypothetical protein
VIDLSAYLGEDGRDDVASVLHVEQGKRGGLVQRLAEHHSPIGLDGRLEEGRHVLEVKSDVHCR